MRGARRLPVDWPAWYYGPNGEAQIFNGPDEVPYGWVGRPGQKFEPVTPVIHDRDDLVNQLEAKGIAVDPRWGVAHMKKVLDDSSTSR